MKFLWLIVFFIHQASFSDDATCRKSLPLMSDLGQEKINTLYNFKNNNHGNWTLADERSHVKFVLEPKKMVTYQLSWKIKHPGKKGHNFQDGGFNCEIPLSWQFKHQKELQIVFPKAAHGLKEDSSLHSLATFAGIYLGKSKYSLHPDVISIIWHLKQTRLSEEVISRIIAPFSFIGVHNLSFLDNTLDENEDVQLVALNFSDTRDFVQGEQHWLVTDSIDHDAIRNSEFKHNTWLPWLKPTRAEFTALTPLELYKTTVLAGLDLAKIYNRSTRSYVPDPISVQDKMQMVYELIAPLVRARIDNNQALFTHLLLQSKNGYELFVFEILQSGVIVPLSSQELNDPSLIGLPSALEAGFGPQSLSTMNTIQ